jgi:hypothetical protein
LTQVTRNGAAPSPAQETRDGEFLYYFTPSGISRLRIRSGEEEVVWPGKVFRFALTDDGIFFTTQGTNNALIQFYDLVTGEVNNVFTGGPTIGGLSISPDGRSLVFHQLAQSGSDLMLVENFR